jgi:hypothetical protein
MLQSGILLCKYLNSPLILFRKFYTLLSNYIFQCSHARFYPYWQMYDLRLLTSSPAPDNILLVYVTAKKALILTTSSLLWIIYITIQISKLALSPESLDI